MDPSEVRDSHLWWLAHLCHLTPADIEETSWIDLLIFTDGCKQWIDAHNNP